MLPGCALALLGAIFLYRRRLASSRAAYARTLQRCARDTADMLGRLVAASRRSSDAVVAALDSAIRDVEPAVDATLVFVSAGEELLCAHASGARAEHFRRFSLRLDHEALLPALAARTACRAVFPAQGAAVLPTDRWAIAVPMLDGSVLRGVTYVSSPQPCSAHEDRIVRVVEGAVTPYVIALEREADRADAMHDGLTGLLGPRAFRRRLQEELSRGDVHAQPAHCLWFIDTDNFKTINDRFGHRAGDTVLQTMASLLRAHLVPDVDVAARNGGDEFCALLRGASKSAAIVRAQAFCEAVRAHDFGVAGSVTASVGVASCPHDAGSWSALLEAADAAMYHSKRNGRDCVSFAIETGNFNVVEPEAGGGLSRSSTQWRSNSEESCTHPSSRCSSSSPELR